MIVKVTYKQKYMGGILTDSYEREISDYDEIGLIHKALYSDPHVCFVDVEILEEVEEMHDSRIQEADLMKNPHDPVNKPSHYTVLGFEVIDIIDALIPNFPVKIAGHLQNTVKYLFRAPFKDKLVEDLKKAEYYLKHSIEILEEEK